MVSISINPRKQAEDNPTPPSPLYLDINIPDAAPLKRKTIKDARGIVADDSAVFKRIKDAISEKII